MQQFEKLRKQMEDAGICPSDENLEALKSICAEMKITFAEAIAEYLKASEGEESNDRVDPVGAVAKGYLPHAEVISQVASDVLVQETQRMTGDLYLQKLCQGGQYKELQVFRPEHLLQRFKDGYQPDRPEPRAIAGGASYKAISAAEQEND